MPVDSVRPALFDTSTDHQVSISLDIGIIPQGYPNVGQWIVTIQAHPLPDQRAANQVALMLKDAIEARLQIKLVGHAPGPRQH